MLVKSGNEQLIDSPTSPLPAGGRGFLRLLPGAAARTGLNARVFGCVHVRPLAP
jgi:hypothetical protein